MFFKNISNDSKHDLPKFNGNMIFLIDPKPLIIIIDIFFRPLRRSIVRVRL